MREVAVGIVQKDGSVLICQRKKGSRYPLKWEFPGGKLEAGESPDEALKRELQEELSIDAGRVEFFFRQEWLYPDQGGEKAGDGAFRVYYYRVLSFSGSPVNRVFEQIRWVPAAELLKMDILEGNREAVELLVRHEETERAPRQTG